MQRWRREERGYLDGERAERSCLSSTTQYGAASCARDVELAVPRAEVCRAVLCEGVVAVLSRDRERLSGTYKRRAPHKRSDVGRALATHDLPAN